jgi:hypothetical protein
MGMSPPENMAIGPGGLRMEFPKGASADVISAAAESARKGGCVSGGCGLTFPNEIVAIEIKQNI